MANKEVIQIDMQDRNKFSLNIKLMTVALTKCAYNSPSERVKGVN